MGSILLIVACLVIAFLLYVNTRPDRMRVKRVAYIKASDKAIFALINNLKAWEKWTPYNKDPEMQKTYSGPEEGIGAKYAWMGNNQVGEGSLTVQNTTAPHEVLFQLEFKKPYVGLNDVTFHITPMDDGTTAVSWILDAPQSFMSKLMGVFMNMDKMIGSDFEVGLANLKKVAES